MFRFNALSLAGLLCLALMTSHGCDQGMNETPGYDTTPSTQPGGGATMDSGANSGTDNSQGVQANPSGSSEREDQTPQVPSNQVPTADQSPAVDPD